MVAPQQKRLLVEGQDDLYAIAELMGHHISWPENKDNAPVRIEDRNGVNGILNKDYIAVSLKSPEVQILGILLDADEDFDGRWSQLIELIEPFFQGMPRKLPAEGFIADLDSGKRIGIWIMPDNKSHGMLETFLQLLVPAKNKAIWEYAKKSVAEARKTGAPCNEKHLDKAHMHTWLAWQEPPGERFGTAILKKILDAKADEAAVFVKWFRELYQI